MLQSVRTGDTLQIAAADWNAIAQTVNAFGRGGRTGGKGLGATPRETAVVQIHNTADERIDYFRAVQVVGIVTSPDDAAAGTVDEFLHAPILTLEIDKPDENGAGVWLVTLDPVEADGIGRAMVVGACPVWVNLTDETATRVDVVEGEVVPVSGSRGYDLLWVKGGVGTADETGEQWAVVRVGTAAAVSGLTPVLVVWVAGDDGDADGRATWTYNIFPLGTDTEGATPLNGETPLQPLNNAARVNLGPVQKAPDDSVGMAFQDETGTWQLWECRELEADASGCATEAEDEEEGG